MVSGGKWLDQEWRRPPASPAHWQPPPSAAEGRPAQTGPGARPLQVVRGGEGASRRGCGCRGWAWGLWKLGGLVDSWQS